MKCCTDKDHTHPKHEKEVKKLPCQNQCPNCKRKEEEKRLKQVKKAAPVTVLLTLAAGAASAQNAPRTFWDDPFNSPMLPVYSVLALVLITVVLVAAVAVKIKDVFDLLTADMLKAKAAKAGVPYVAPQSWWQKTWESMNAAVPVEQEKVIDLGHNFDGIRELDNHLPPWWKGLFYGCIVWGVFYLFFYHVVPTFPLSRDEYKNELTAAEDQARMLKASMPPEVIDAETLAFTDDQEFIGKGKLVFTGNNCGSCHRTDGGGNAIGPNLTDKYWLHGGEVKNIFGTINKGVVEKGMPAWGKVMSAADVRNVTFYVISLQGSNPPDAKSPQGDMFEIVKKVALDSTKTK
jgi:cytochrome c oxidase cbb3-type subunit 3